MKKVGFETEAVTCSNKAKGDAEKTVEASLIENVARLLIDDTDQFEASNAC